MKIHVLGYYGMNNVGDEAFRPAMSYIFDGHNVEFFNIDVYRELPHPTPDVLVLGGGDVVTPYYLPVVSQNHAKIKIGLGVGLGYESESELAAKAGFTGWFLRNHSDVSLVKSHTSIPIEYTPDLAFGLKPSGNKVLHRYVPFGRPVVAVMLTDYLMPAHTRSEESFWDRTRAFLPHFGDFCTQLYRQGFDIVMVPCSGDGHADDRRVHMSVRAFTSKPVFCIPDLLSPQDMIDLLAEVDYTVCQRFHSHVFAMIAGKPILSISFTRKVNKLLEAAGGGFDAKCFSGGNYVKVDLIGAFDEMKKEADAHCVRFLSFAESNRNDLSQVKQKVLRLIDG